MREEMRPRAPVHAERVLVMESRRAPDLIRLAERSERLAPDIERATRLVTDGSLSRVFRSLPDLPALWIPT